MLLSVLNPGPYILLPSKLERVLCAIKVFPGNKSITELLADPEGISSPETVVLFSARQIHAMGMGRRERCWERPPSLERMPCG